MNSILLAISNSVSAMPVSISIAPPVPVGRGGFGSILADAQAFSAASKSTANAGSSSSALETNSGKSAAGTVVPSLPASGSQAKKQLSNSSATVSPPNGLGFQVPLPDPGLSLLPTSDPAASIPSVGSGGTVQTESSFAYSAAVLKNTASDYTTGNNQLQGPLISNQTAGLTLGQNLMPGAGASGIVQPETSPPNNLSPNNSVDHYPSAPVNASPAFGMRSGSTEENLAPPSALMDLSNQNEIAALSTGQSGPLTPASALFVPRSSVDSVATTNEIGVASAPNQIVANNGGKEIQTAGGTLAASIPQVSQAVGLSEPGPILLAKVFSDTALVVGAQLVSAISVPILAQAGLSAAELNAAATPVNHPAETGTGSWPEGLNAQNSPPVSDLWSAIIPQIPAAQFAAPKVSAAVPSPMADGAPQSPGVPTAARPVALPKVLDSSNLDSSNPSPASSQTPFSVFFSSPGPGTESAASVLPKTILPTAGSAFQDSHTVPTTPGGTTNPNAEISAVPGVPQSAAARNSKDSTAGTASGNIPSAPLLRHNGDASAASVQQTSPQTGPPPVPPPAAPVAEAILPLGGQPALVADPMPKSSSLPAPSPAREIPAPEQATVVPGLVQVAQLMTRVQQSEMRIGMNTSAFGSVEVRTVVHANDVGLVIGSEKGDLRTLLANDIPVITNTLQQQNLRLNSVNFMQGFAFSNNASGGGNSQPQSFVPMRASANSGLPGVAEDESRDLGSAREFESGAGSLSILA